MISRLKPVTHVRLIAEDLMLLVEQEMSLARQELDQKINQAFQGAVMAVAGLLAGFIAIVVLVQALIAALAVEMPQWLAATIVGGLALIAAVLLISVAYSRLKPANLAPNRTIHSLSRTAQTVKEHMK